MKSILCLLCIAFLSGCTTVSIVPYEIESNPPGAHIDVNGNSMGVTPTKINLLCKKQWVGLAVAPEGWAYEHKMTEIVAYLSEDNPGASQTKRVNPCQLTTPPGRIFFDLRLDPVSPRQKIDVNVNQNDRATTVDDTIRILKRLREQGLLSDQEYQQKVDKVVKDAAQ